MVTANATSGREDDGKTVAEGTWVQSDADRERSRAHSLRREHPPASVPGYQIKDSLGEGAYGSVWLATELGTGKNVAIKFYTQRRGLDWSLLNREVEKLAVLYTCRNIVGLIAVGWNSDPPHYVMEYLENGSLSNLLEKGPLTAKEAARIGRDVLMALVHAHGSGILHCDLKPANILLDKNLDARLADFGQSRLSHEQHHALGTLFFMAPEQADINAVPDARWDVYAWGAVLYQALTGEPPYRSAANEKRLADTQPAERRLETYQQILRNDPRPKAHWRARGVDRRLAEIIDRCLQIDPNLRFPNAQAVLDALDARTRHMTNRPLLTLGIAAPIALLLVIGTLANNAMSAAVRSAQDNLLDRALESDAVTVKILARSIERELEDRTSELRKVAEDTRLAAALESEASLPWEERTKLREVLGEWKSLVDEARKRQGLEPDTSWFVDDAQGLQLYRHPYEARTVGKNYRFRDYFHGRRINYPKDNVPADVVPIHEPYVSMAYRSEATDAYRVAITVPVFSSSRDKVIGVLGRSMSLEQLLAAYKPQIEAAGTTNQIERTIALYDGHVTNDVKHVPTFHLLDHPWLSDRKLARLTEVARKRLQVDAEHARQLAQLQIRVESSAPSSKPLDVADLDRSLDFQDPVSLVDQEHYGGTWLAAFWPVGKTDWIAVVQERRSTAKHPVQQMELKLTQYMRLGLLFCCGLIGSLWYFIFRVLSDQSRGR
ncbi:MAG: Serine/threonine protein kinaserelated protein [Planctomycetaceae bacterium]|nr:Serine/threonine protein kinaserelated protein [Planctomycetaceae bacterium]